MTTSNFRTAGDNPLAVAISRGAPWAYRGRRYRALAPTPTQRHLTGEAFRLSYEADLEKMDARRVYEELGPDAILLCWEPPGERCHRCMVAEWFKRKLGIAIPELTAINAPRPVISLSFRPPPRLPRLAFKPQMSLGLEINV